MGMRRVCGGHPSDKPKFMEQDPTPPLRDELPTQPVRQGIAARVVNLASRASR